LDPAPAACRKIKPQLIHLSFAVLLIYWYGLNPNLFSILLRQGYAVEQVGAKPMVVVMSVLLGYFVQR
jgi:hypothetical protein